MFIVFFVFFQAVYDHLPQVRKLDNDSKKMVVEMLEMKANKKILQNHLIQQTGKCVLLRDLHNLSPGKIPNSCAVFGCSSNYRQKGSTTFHRFPKDVELNKRWIHLCNRQDPINAKNALICSLHFKESDFERNLKYELLKKPVPNHLVQLKKGSVPTLHLPRTQGNIYEIIL